ncbi:hypothetical protein CVIRNUC_008753 [Coccomyxa viridis]|uniref:Uncharacterized protein n=1 Tax=Coccomyxa viridis TaxID=1274662 RepID=A0AAV1IE32_9CHLO|nr:hypothetical protein CVIRNUC_008753 [Coccomyxa viridis]
MSLLGKLRPSVLRHFRPKASDSHASDSFLSAGKNQPGGYLFNETPPPPGQRRKLESWELPWYFTMLAAAAMLTVGLQAKPDTDPQKLARKEAIKQLKAEGKL